MIKKVLKAYERLVPNDQVIIDAMIVALFTKDREIHDLVKAMHEQLGKAEVEGGES